MTAPANIIHNGITLAEHLRLHEMWLRGEYGGVRADLSDADLTRSDLTGADLSDADLTRSDLTGSDLTGADLTGSDLTGASLTGANLSGANLSCFGNMHEVKTLQIERWQIGYTADALQIGCQRHPISKWRKWNTEAGRVWIAKMDDTAPEWAERLLPLILAIIDASPATPTGHERSAQ